MVNHEIGTSATTRPEYTERLRRTDGFFAALKQLPYRAHLRRLRLGNVLDLGCGIGRNLRHNGGRGVGVDHNPTSVHVANERGLCAFTPDEFFASGRAAERYDSVLCAHVAEHMDGPAFLDFARRYVPLLASGGRFVLITPQQRGFASDATHVHYVDFAGQRELLASLGLEVESQYSFPLPESAGTIFTYNEFVSIARKA